MQRTAMCRPKRTGLVLELPVHLACTIWNAPTLVLFNVMCQMVPRRGRGHALLQIRKNNSAHHAFGNVSLRDACIMYIFSCSLTMTVLSARSCLRSDADVSARARDIVSSQREVDMGHAQSTTSSERHHVSCRTPCALLSACRSFA